MNGNGAAAPSLSKRLVRGFVDRVGPHVRLVRRGSPARRRVALTFDDGPSPLTGEYLDLLERHQARATFFLVGREAERRPEFVREIARRGHEVASHGFSHQPFPKLRRAELVDELRRTAALLPPPGRRPLVRPPFGALNIPALLQCARLGFTTVMWSLDSHDSGTEVAAEVAAKVHPDHLAPGEIILLHEDQRWTLAALPEILTRIAEARYELVTVSELLS
jgi:peptidoglycan-N-acetylglucosamine deacetylase